MSNHLLATYYFQDHTYYMKKLNNICKKNTDRKSSYL